MLLFSAYLMAYIPSPHFGDIWEFLIEDNKVLVTCVAQFQSLLVRNNTNYYVIS